MNKEAIVDGKKIQLNDIVRLKFNDLTLAKEVAERVNISNPLDLEKLDYTVTFIGLKCDCGCGATTIVVKGTAGMEWKYFVANSMAMYLKAFAVDSRYTDEMWEKVKYAMNEDPAGYYLLMNSEVGIAEIVTK